MVELSFTNAPLIGAGKWVGLDNYFRLASDRSVFDRRLEHDLLRHPVGHSRHHSGARHRARGQPPEGLDAEHRARGVLPALHPAGVGRLPDLGLDVRQGLRRRPIRHRALERRPASLGVPDDSAVHAGGRLHHGLVAASASTCCCSSPGLRNISSEIYEAAELDGAGRWAQFRRITWPLIWPVTVLVLHHPAHPAAQDLRPGLSVPAGRPHRRQHGHGALHSTSRRSSSNKGGLGAAAAVVLFVVIVILSVLQFQLLARARAAMSASVQTRRRCRAPGQAAARATQPPRRRRAFHHDLHLGRRDHLGLPALLGPGHDVQA